MLEALLLAAAQAAAAPPPAATPVKSTPPATAKAPPPAPPPSADLLEFLADWSEEEAGLIDEVIVPAAAARAPRKERAP